MTTKIIPEQTSLLTTLHDRFTALRQKAATASEVWQPEAGECLVGVLKGSKKAVGAFGENYQALIERESGTVVACWLTPWLKENMRVQGAEVGDLIAVTFLGKKESPNGRKYNAYSLIVEKSWMTNGEEVVRQQSPVSDDVTYRG